MRRLYGLPQHLYIALAAVCLAVLRLLHLTDGVQHPGAEQRLQSSGAVGRKNGAYHHPRHGVTCQTLQTIGAKDAVTHAPFVYATYELSSDTDGLTLLPARGRARHLTILSSDDDCSSDEDEAGEDDGGYDGGGEGDYGDDYDDSSDMSDDSD